MRSAYYVLITGAVFAGVYMPFVASGWALVQAMLFFIVLAELVHYGVVIAAYRRES